MGDAAAITVGFLGILNWCLLDRGMFKGFGRSMKKPVLEENELMAMKFSAICRWFYWLILTLMLTFTAFPAYAAHIGTVEEFSIVYPNRSEKPGSTHEITYNKKGKNVFWVTGQNYDRVVEVTLDGKTTFHPMPNGSGPHGIEFDAAGNLWITLEFLGAIARLDSNGNIVAKYDVQLDCSTCKTKINTHPHGLGIGSDGKTVWYTGKATGTLGRITSEGEVETFALSSVGSVPIYINAGPDGNMWFTELVGNAVGRITPDGQITEYPIPTLNSRPIAIVADPSGKAMWFTEEAGNKIGRIDLQGNITEFPVPKTQNNVILASLTFDNQRNLWVEQYVDANNPNSNSPDYIIKIDRRIRESEPEDISQIPFTFYQVPTHNTVMHRITQGPDKNIWFTELRSDKVGRVLTTSN
ncbi:hypothetical protein GNF10_22280 [Nostoc sp. UCD121]|uniref:Vgb family protein n=1 Tax=unclassified Nostoc TaxID=2593658 RepID=UPI001623FE2F|nr:MULTISPECIES: hypothetical protein [unclassified Nostoc]MBC1221102.1 hypothetical protein [Nostoc sp. UCD120]MBC1278618.1 hypothetical protein [Nostoc sp. UCD121]MBC1299330.1 hypothetical protein [Nostoc sp. UCD122]